MRTAKGRYQGTGMKYLNVPMPPNNTTPMACARIAIMPKVEQRRPWSATTMTDPYMLRVSARIAILASTTRIRDLKREEQS